MIKIKIQTKYEIGQKVWVIYEKDKEICLFSDEIIEIITNKNGISYFLNLCDEDIKENDIISYENTDLLLEKIIDLDISYCKED